MTRAKLTAIVTTFNEEANIQECLRCLSFADEVLVADSFSTDKTLEIARDFGARIVQREYQCAASQKNWAIPQASHEWVLLCDADERVTDELRQEVQELLSGQPQHVGYSIPRANCFLGRWIRHCGWSPERDSNTRLFLRDRSRYEEKEVHADIICDGPVGVINSPLMHYSFVTIDQYISKMNRYTTWAARDILSSGRKVGGLEVSLRPIGTFLRMYVLQAGFLDGVHGLILCIASAFYTFAKYAKAWLLIHHKTDSGTENS